MTPGDSHATDREASANALLDRLETKGSAWYGGERVTQLEHALQCAALAEVEGGPPELVLASLLHDIGHFLTPRPISGVNDSHEQVGADALCRVFGPKIGEPVRLHVDAKRYLVTTEPSYGLLLSPESRRSLELQGGPMTHEACQAFLAHPHAAQAIRLRRYDERAKVPQKQTPTLDHYRPLARAWARQRP